MQYIKKSVLGLCVSLSIILLFTFGLAFGLYRMLGTPDTIKSALQESDLYDSVVGDVLRETQKDQAASANRGELPLDRPEVQEVVSNAVPPQMLQTQAETVLDSVYSWAQGKTDSLEFTVDLSEAKTSLADDIAQYVQERSEGLPTCPPGSALRYDVDPFNATCLPPGVSPAQVAEQSKSEVLNSEALKDTTFTADDIKIGNNEKPLEEQLQAIPVAYKGLQWSVYITGFLALLTLAGVLFLSVGHRAGLKKLSVVLIFVGVVSAGLGWLGSYGATKAGEIAGDQSLQQSGAKVIQYLANNMRGWWMVYGAILAVLGIAALVAMRFVKPASPAETAQPEGPKAKPDKPQNPEPPAPNPSAGKPANKQKPKPVKKLVQ